jgi:FtsH-binding integral membrane protein
MTALVISLVFCQALGALTGAFSVVWGELAYVRAMRDGRLNRAEREHLDHIARGLRFGMTLLLLSSFALVVVAYVAHAATQPALMANYWILIALALLVTGVSWALSRGRISFRLGTATAFTGWWFLAFLTLGQIPPLSFGSAVAFFVVATAIFYVLLWFARSLALHKK